MKLDRDELSFRFSERYYKQIQKYEDKIYDSAFAIRKTGSRWLKSASNEEINEKIILCDTCIEAFNAFKTYCISKGKGGEYYFKDRWEHLHNSKNPDFSYGDSVISQRETLANALK